MKHDLSKLIAQGEGTRLEFKSTISSAYRIARTLTALSNTSGGLLIVGVADDGRITGVESEYREMQKIEKATDFLIDSPISISYEVVHYEGKSILIIEIPESDDKPHYAIDEQGHRTIYVRTKDKSVPTNRLIVAPTQDVDTQLLQSSNVRSLLQYLRKNTSIDAVRFANLVNISSNRAGKLLYQLTEQGLLIMIDKRHPVEFSLKLKE